MKIEIIHPGQMTQTGGGLTPVVMTLTGHAQRTTITDEQGVSHNVESLLVTVAALQAERKKLLAAVANQEETIKAMQSVAPSKVMITLAPNHVVESTGYALRIFPMAIDPRTPCGGCKGVTSENCPDCNGTGRHA